MYTFQDFQKETDVAHAVNVIIAKHLSSDDYKTACDADLYDHQKNKTIYEYVHKIFTLSGTPIEDFTASNNKIASNFFRRLNTQRVTYSLGNGISFAEHEEYKESLGKDFDNKLKSLAYFACIHGIAFGFWNVEGMHVFKLTEFAPLWDEETGALRGGVRYWQIDKSKPMLAVLYEEDGYTKYRREVDQADFKEIKPKSAYKVKVKVSEADGEEVVGESNYDVLPILPLWGSELKQSTLIGLQRSIDSFDLIRSGFANDLTDCAQIYWILSNTGGMSDKELAQFRDRLKITHIAVADTDNSEVTPYSQEIPYNARQTYLTEIRSGIYEDFGGLDVHSVEAGSTNDHIDAAYQPMDENADDFEYQIIDFILKLENLLGLEEDPPIFKRNKISNQREQVDMIMASAEVLDDETILKKLPFITPDEVEDILKKKTEEAENRYSDEQIEKRLGALEAEKTEETEEEELNG